MLTEELRNIWKYMLKRYYTNGFDIKKILYKILVEKILYIDISWKDIIQMFGEFVVNTNNLVQTSNL